MRTHKPHPETSNTYKTCTGTSFLLSTLQARMAHVLLYSQDAHTRKDPTSHSKATRASWPSREASSPSLSTLTSATVRAAYRSRFSLPTSASTPTPESSSTADNAESERQLGRHAAFGSEIGMSRTDCAYHAVILCAYTLKLITVLQPRSIYPKRTRRTSIR